MEIRNRNRKIDTHVIYEIIIFDEKMDNGELHKMFTDLEEAKKESKEMKKKYYNNNTFEVNKLIWSDEEEKYVNIYENNSLVPPVFEI